MSSRPRRSTGISILACLAVACVLLAAYVGAYLCAGKRQDVFLATGPYWIEPVAGRPIISRTYKSHWLVALFAPASQVETVLRNKEVHVQFDDFTLD
jgi:hypothetical protein